MKLGYSFFNLLDGLTRQGNVFCRSHAAPPSVLSCKAGKTVQWKTARSELGAMEKSPGGSVTSTLCHQSALARCREQPATEKIVLQLGGRRKGLDYSGTEELMLDSRCNPAVSNSLRCSQTPGKQFLGGQIELEGQLLTPVSRELVCTLEQNDCSCLV